MKKQSVNIEEVRAVVNGDLLKTAHLDFVRLMAMPLTIDVAQFVLGKSRSTVVRKIGAYKAAKGLRRNQTVTVAGFLSWETDMELSAFVPCLPQEQPKKAS